MWRTSCGERVLVGKERSLFVHAAASLLDHLLEEEDDDSDHAAGTGVARFDHLDPDARIVLLRDVVQALTDPAIPAPELTAFNEAAVHAVFRFVRGEIEMEIDCEDIHAEQEPADSFLGYDPHYWRKLVLAAYREGRETDHDDEESLNPAGTDMEEWDLQLESLANQILWDRDWELEEIMDAPPEQSRTLKRRLGIDEDYFLANPADPAVRPGE